MGKRVPSLATPQRKNAHSAPAASAAPAIPTIGGSFSVNEAVSDAWNSGRPISDVLNAQPATPVPQAASVVPASSVAAAVSAQPQQPTGTESSFVVPQRGEAAHLQVSTSVGNSASAPISSPPSAAKADPNTMNLAAMRASLAAVLLSVPEPFQRDPPRRRSRCRPRDEEECRHPGQHAGQLRRQDHHAGHLPRPVGYPV